MDNSKKIQIGLLGTVVVLFALHQMGVFDSWFGKAGDAMSDAQADVTAVTGDVSPSTTNTVSNNTAEAAVPAGPTTKISFEESEFDYGLIEQGEKVTHVYSFTNDRDEPLIISNAKGSCGCTVPNWPKDPIMPGEKGEIKVQFDSKGKSGKQNKRVTITANTDPTQTFLTIKGEVKKPAGAADTPPIKVQPAQ